jgi:hypothetical protein
MKLSIIIYRIMKLVTMKYTQHDDTHHNDIENNGTLYNEINTA